MSKLRNMSTRMNNYTKAVVEIGSLRLVLDVGLHEQFFPGFVRQNYVMQINGKPAFRNGGVCNQVIIMQTILN